MEECELCGRMTKDVYILDIENVEMRACASCAEGKRIIRSELQSQPRGGPGQRGRTQPRRKQDEVPVLIDGYGMAIRRARERMQLPLKVLAEMLNEKEHLLLRVEEERTEPTLELTKKLERALSIKLNEQPTEESKVSGGGKGGSATIGDFFEKK